MIQLLLKLQQLLLTDNHVRMEYNNLDNIKSLPSKQ